MARRINKRKIALRIITVIICLSIISIAVSYALKVKKILESELVYENLFVDNVNVSGMTYEELESFLYKNYQNKVEEISFQVDVKGKIYTASLKDFEVKYDIASTVEKIYSVGREGSITEKYSTIKKAQEEPVVVTFDYIYNESIIDEFVDNIFREAYVEESPSTYTIKQDELLVELHSGNRSETLDKGLLKNEIKDIVENAKAGVIITAKIDYGEMNMIDGKEIFDKVYVRSKNASSDIIGKELKIIPHQVGQEIDADLLRETVDYINSNEKADRTVEIKKVHPEITTEIYESNLFTSTLGSKSTQFYTTSENGKARATNIKKATDIINGTLIAPGQVFSFNGVVGPRSVDLGYAIAHVYLRGEVVDGVGGGICQVSSTLYNAVLFADLLVTDRRSHMFTVPYVPLGADATVDYYQSGFQIRKQHRLSYRIEGSVSEDNKVHFTIIGTDPDPSITIAIDSIVKEKIPFEVVYVDDPTLAKGTQTVKQDGMEGYVAEALKVYYKDGKFLKEVSLGVVTYSKLDKIILVGTK